MSLSLSLSKLGVTPLTCLRIVTPASFPSRRPQIGVHCRSAQDSNPPNHRLNQQGRATRQEAATRLYTIGDVEECRSRAVRKNQSF